MYPDSAVQHLLDWKHDQMDGLMDGLFDAVEEYGVPEWDLIRDAEGSVTAEADFARLRDGGFLA